MAYERQPLIWMNMTTSANWHRPPVGIVRVERALAQHLQAQLGDERLKLCVWKDDGFVEWVPTQSVVPPKVTNAVDAILPRTASFDLARPYLVRALMKFAKTELPGENRSAELQVSVPTRKQLPAHPAPGDFIISVGLDWDNQYTERFYALSKKQGLRIITCCYDLIPVLFPQYCVGEVAKRFTEYFLQLSWGSEAVLCISEQTRRDYAQLCDELGAPNRKTVVIPLGDNIPTGSAGIGDEVRVVTQTPFILFVSTIERRKNHEVLYRAYHLLARRGLLKLLPKLVFVGMPGWGIGDLMKDIELDPLTSGLIVQLNHVTDSELGQLYKHALFCVYPSLYEGWGLPVGEALAVGKAVISSDEGSLPEVGGDLVRYVSAWDPNEWADAIREYLENPQLIRDAEHKVQVGYKPRQWSETAKTVRQLIDELSAADREMSLELLPGYDLSTICGMHVGPSICSTGSAGLLLFGPHRALRKGRYHAQIFGSLLDGHSGTVLFKIASGDGNTIHFTHSFDLPRTNASDGWPIELPFTLEKDVSDIEIKCTVFESSGIRVDRVTVRRVVNTGSSPRHEEIPATMD